MVLFVEFIIVVLLVFILVTVYIDERRTRYQKIPMAKMTAYWTGRERRCDVRIDKALNVRYVVGKKPNITKNSLTKNIGKGGVLLETDEKLTVETYLDMEIEIPSYQKSIFAYGKVVWTKEAHVENQTDKRMFNAGIKFDYIKPQEKDLFEKYVESVIV